MEDKAFYIKSSREIRQCDVFLTCKRIAAYDKPSSFIKSVTNFMSDSKVACFEIPIKNLSSIRDGRYGPKSIVILKTDDGVEYPVHFNLPGQNWKQAIVNTIVENEPDTIVKTVGDYVRFKRQQPR